MGKLLGILMIPVLLVALVFGYFMSQNSWDPKLSYHVMMYEVKKITGDASDNAVSSVESVVPDSQMETEVPETTEQGSESQEAEVFEKTGKNGETKFSDVQN